MTHQFNGIPILFKLVQYNVKLIAPDKLLKKTTKPGFISDFLVTWLHQKSSLDPITSCHDCAPFYKTTRKDFVFFYGYEWRHKRFISDCAIEK